MEAAVKAAQKQIKTLKSLLKETKEEMKELQVTHKWRSERSVALKKATAAMTLAQLKKELESRRMCSYGRAPDLKQRLVLELAGRCQSDSIDLHSAAAAAVTAAMSAMQKQLQPQLESVRSGATIVAPTALRLLGGDTDEFDEAIAEMSIALDVAEATTSGSAQEPDQVGNCAVISRRRLEQSLAAADFQQVGVSKSERARLTDTHFELRESERPKITGTYFDKHNLMVSVVSQVSCKHRFVI